MLSEEGTQNLFNQVNKLWIDPEILRRKQANSLPEGFKIRQCLIKLPKDQPPIIEFNNEIKWLGHLKMVPGIPLNPGQAIYLHEVEQIAAVSLPEIDGKLVAFVYFFFNGLGYQIIFDFLPNAPDESLSENEKNEGELSISLAIAESLQASLVERTIHIHNSNQQQLQKIGLWAAPALLPYPLSKIIKQLDENDIEGAHRTLIEYCTSQYIERLSKKWWTIDQFNKRKNLIQDALDAHKIVCSPECLDFIYSGSKFIFIF
jgi:hypothetical protein